MAAKNNIRVAIIISAATFGIGHIVNLLSGRANPETVIQIFFAVAWGFIFTMVFYKSKSLIPCILAHGLVDAFSKFSANNITSEWIYMGATIAAAVLYCTYLVKAKDQVRTA